MIRSVIDNQQHRLAEMLNESLPRGAGRAAGAATVNRIVDIEKERGQIARAERSALDPEAQPLQDLLDRMLYRMAGLTDDETRRLEERLARML